MKFKRLKFKNLLMSLTLSASLLLSFGVTVFADPFVHAELNARQQKICNFGLKILKHKAPRFRAQIDLTTILCVEIIARGGVYDANGRLESPWNIVPLIEWRDGILLVSVHRLARFLQSSKAAVNKAFKLIGYTKESIHLPIHALAKATIAFNIPNDPITKWTVRKPMAITTYMPVKWPGADLEHLWNPAQEPAYDLDDFN
ncbi:MAG: hypothetical protein LBJ95_01465 [Oscillospiraceae bacterium]|jgi:hypothetical protein|nr:hypothetical protein [Oscillospiraceae bacterium]